LSSHKPQEVVGITNSQSLLSSDEDSARKNFAETTS